MSLPVREGIDIVRRHGPVAGGYHLSNYFDLWLPVWNTVTSRRPTGTNVFEREWDLLVVLDACRADCLRAAAETTPWLGRVDTERSVGSMSAEWMVNTFTNSHAAAIEDTAVVSANAWSSYILDNRYHEKTDHDYQYMHPGYPDWQVVPSGTLAYHESVRPRGDDGLLLHPESKRIPHVVTDRAIDVARRRDDKRLIVHYNLPHLEHIAGALDWQRGAASTTELMDGPEPIRELRAEESSWDPGRAGDVSPSTYRDNYMATLRLVLEYVEILLSNVDAETVAITADHGEAFGENGVWGHPFGHPFAPVRTVPWATTTATDERTYEPRHSRTDGQQTEQEQREFLHRMGYLE